jgi:branched-chain amino acid transport system substrate-binding protein/neutral amino acid transport system substrate-binding protein
MIARQLTLPIVGLLVLTALAGCMNTSSGNAIKTDCGKSTGSIVPGLGFVTAAASVSSLLQADFASAPSTGLAQAQDQGATTPLKLGTMLPITGDLSAYGPGMQDATDLAVHDINAAGGVNGQPVQIQHVDDKTDVTTSAQVFNTLINDGVVAVVGGAASSETGAVLSTAVQHQIVLITPASTAASLTAQNNSGYFYRVPPSDNLQGIVLAKLVYSEGCHSASVIYINNAYGSGLSATFKTDFQKLGGTVKSLIAYDSGGKDAPYKTQAQQAASDGPDAVVVIGYPDTGSGVLKALYTAGVMQNAATYMSEGMMSDTLANLAGNVSGTNTSIAVGLKGTTPSTLASSVRPLFNAEFKATYNMDPPLFAAESYDAVMAAALAAQCAGSNTGPAIKGAMLNVWNYKSGATNVTGVNGTAVALTLAKACAVKAIHYVGVSGDVNRDTNGDPTAGNYAYWKVTAAGKAEIYQNNISASS